MTTTRAIRVQHRLSWLAFTFFSTLLAYNFQRIIRFEFLERHSVRSVWLKTNKRWLYFLTVIGFIGSAILLFFLPPRIWWLLFLPAGISFFYVVPFNSRKQSLREFPFLKIYLIALSWAFVAVVVPLLLTRHDNTVLSIMFFEKFFFVLALTIPFDIRDLSYDSPIKKTIPQVLGVRRSLVVALLALLLSGIMAYLLYGLGYYSSAVFYGLEVSYCLSAFVIAQTNTQRPELFYTGILDGMFLVQFLLVYSFSHYL